MKKKLDITIVGGGSSAHTLIPLLYNGGHNVNILTSRPDEWKNIIEVEYKDEDGKKIKSLKGRLNIISNNPLDVIPNSDVIILCMPVYKYRIALDRIAGFIKNDNKVYIGTVYGQAGFNWMIDEVVSKYQLSNIAMFAFGLIPWICRIQKYGETGVTYGCKERNVAAVFPKTDFDFLNENLFNAMCFDWFNTGKVVLSDNFISLTLSVDNQIIHTTRCYSLSKKNPQGWDSIDEVPYFYKDYDDLSADVLLKLDQDYSKVRNAIKDKYPNKKFKYMLDYLALERYSYNSQNNDIKESFLNSKTLAAIGTPVVENDKGKYILDKSHRFFYDDIFYGNCILKAIALNLNIKVPMVDEIIKWAENILKIKILDDSGNFDKKLIKSSSLILGIPDVYGYDELDDLVD